jgi:hypothetical protein
MPTEAMITSTVASLLHATQTPGNDTIEYITPIYSPLFGVMGIVASIVFSCKSSLFIWLNQICSSSVAFKVSALLMEQQSQDLG